MASARGHRLHGRAAAHGDAQGSRRHFDRALAAFTALGMPYEVATTQLSLAEALRGSDSDLAEAEARRALAAFERL